jgi:ABC-type sulfate transport system permease subunit
MRYPVTLTSARSFGDFYVSIMVYGKIFAVTKSINLLK